jgi:transcriptional regulator with XRE-family HTH domain
MRAKRVKLSDQIRRAVDASGVSRYRICKGIGLDQGTMSKFMAGYSGLSVATLDALADALGLDVVARGPVNVPPLGRPGRKPKAKKGGAS